MFDIGFTELLLLGVVALVVLGPERLPHAARMAGAWIGKIRRSFGALQVEIEREVNTSEMRERIKKEAEKAGLKDIEAELNEAVAHAQNMAENHESHYNPHADGSDSTDFNPDDHEHHADQDEQGCETSAQPETRQAPVSGAHDLKDNKTSG